MVLSEETIKQIAAQFTMWAALTAMVWKAFDYLEKKIGQKSIKEVLKEIFTMRNDIKNLELSDREQDEKLKQVDARMEKMMDNILKFLTK